MKKLLLFSMILISVLLITGCGNRKVLNCSQTIVQSGFKQMVDLNAEYDDDKIVYYGLRYDMDLSAYGDSEINQLNSQDMCSMVKANLSSYSNAITNCRQQIDNKHLVITADYDLDVLMSMSTKKTTIEELKAELEKQNYTCKIN